MQFDYIIWTGDLPSHTVWNQTRAGQTSLLLTLTDLLVKYFPNKRIFPALGNHESAPVNRSDLLLYILYIFSVNFWINIIVSTKDVLYLSLKNLTSMLVLLYCIITQCSLVSTILNIVEHDLFKTTVILRILVEREISFNRLGELMGASDTWSYIFLLPVYKKTWCKLFL